MSKTIKAIKSELDLNYTSSSVGSQRSQILPYTMSNYFYCTDVTELVISIVG